MSFINLGSTQHKLVENFLHQIKDNPNNHRTIHKEFRSQGLVVPNQYSQEWIYLLYLAKTGKFTSEEKLRHFRVNPEGRIFILLDMDQIINDVEKPKWWTPDVENLVDELWTPEGIPITNPENFNSWFSTKIAQFPVSPNPIEPKQSLDDPKVTYKRDKNGQEPKKTPNGLKKVRLYPSASQKEKLHQVFDANRWAWNVVLKKTKNEFYDRKVAELKKESRPLIQKKTMIAPQYTKAAPEEVFDSAFRDLWKSRDTTLALSKKQKDATGIGFKCTAPKWRYRKMHSQTIEIRARAINLLDGGVSFWPTFFGVNDKVFKIKDNLESFEYSCRLQKEHTGKYYLIVPYYHEKTKSKATKTCSIDPGIRTMLTGYDPEGVIFEFGTELDRIIKRWVIIDKIKGQLRTYHSNRTRRYAKKRKMLNTYGKIKRMISDCHHKTSKWISEHYNKVLLPFLRTKDLVAGKRLAPQVKRRLFAWSHYRSKNC